MTNRMSNSLKRRLAILDRAASNFGCLVNAKWCFALVQEPAMKQLLKRGLVTLTRECVGSSNRTFAKITPEGRKYVAESRRRYQINSLVAQR